MVEAIPRDPKLPLYTDKCRCMACGEYFNSSSAFTKHRVGPLGHARRCLTPAQLRARGWFLTDTGHWASMRRLPPAPQEPSP